MAYRKTEKIIRHLAERQAAIVAAAIEVIALVSADGLQVESVARRAHVAVGTIYKYFPSREDLVAAATATVLEADVAAIQDAAAGARNPGPALAAAVAEFVARAHRRPRVVRAMGDIPAYRLTIRDEFETLVRAAAGELPDQDARQTACGLVGALFECLALQGADTRQLTLLGLRCVGMTEARAKVLASTAGPSRHLVAG